MRVTGRIGSERIQELIIAGPPCQVELQLQISFHPHKRKQEHFMIFHHYQEMETVLFGKIWALFLLSSLFVRVCVCMCVCISMTWPVFVLAAIQKKPSVQSDKVPISQSCDSDFLSVCPTAAEGLSIQAHARIPPISSNTNSCSQLKTVMSAFLFSLLSVPWPITVAI